MRFKYFQLFGKDLRNELIFYKLIQVLTKKGWNRINLSLINARLFPTFEVKEIHMTSQYSILVNAKITSIF